MYFVRVLFIIDNFKQKNMKILDKNEMKNIKGGSGNGCCYGRIQSEYTDCNLTRAQAIGRATRDAISSGTRYSWCCASCQ
jgi:bacteriocin-like protein